MVDDILTAIDQAIIGPTRGSLSRWMKRNYPELAKRLTGHQNDWTALAKVFAASQLQDRDGKPPTPTSARKTWERVRREMTQQDRTRPVARQPPATTSPPPTQIATEPDQTTPAQTTPVTRRRRTFEISRPKKD